MTSQIDTQLQTILSNRHYRRIKVFVHSLGSADYSYFQSIFDDVDLYHSNTELIVFYAPDVPNDKEEKYRQVTKLLSSYGKSLDNLSHGRNLIHKMLLENRLHVTKLDTHNLD